jgi:hypothetical protein
MLEKVAENLSGIWFVIAVVILFTVLGIPYIVRVWREVVSHREQIENAKMQLEILQNYLQFVDSSDVDTITRVREKARKLAFETVIEPKATESQEIAARLLAFVFATVSLCIGTFLGFLPVGWFAKEQNPVPMVLSVAGVVYVAFRIIRAAEKDGRELGPYGGSFVAGLFIGSVGFILVGIVWWLID